MELSSPNQFRERLYPSAVWWLLLLGIVGSIGWILLVAIDPIVALAIVAVLFTAGAISLLVSGSAKIVAQTGRITVGQAHLEDEFLGAVTPLAPDQWRLALTNAGREPAFIFTRPWIDRGLRIEVNDPEDPIEYWLISTRLPDSLANAIGNTGTANDSERTVSDDAQEG
ncbi:MAG TPA: DUF3093 domain-containing protein [Aeromicrobium sp.]|nr:DUF3093 domain-containing protein [Aeromicrobium sp.]